MFNASLLWRAWRGVSETLSRDSIACQFWSLENFEVAKELVGGGDVVDGVGLRGGGVGPGRTRAAKIRQIV
jgi:hypothetical protein